MSYKHSIATVSLSGTLPQKLKAIARAGYEGVELFENDLLVSHLTPTEVGRMATDLGLEIITLQPFRDFEGMPAAQRAKNLVRAEHKFDLMEKLGTQLLFVCSNVSPLAGRDINRAAEDLAELADRAALRGFSVGYEALSWGKFVADYRLAADIVRRANRPNLLNCLDSFHVGVVGSDLTELRNIPGDRIALVQLADAPRYDMGAMHLSRHYRCFPGQGTMPVVPFMQALATTGYQGYISHEIFSDEFRGLQRDQTARDGKRSLVWIERVTTSPEPAPVVLDDLAFVEFAFPSTNQADFINLLHNLGFAETHRHRIKDVSLYRSGNINLVLNRQPDSYASDFVQKHGPGVCALGLRTQHPDTVPAWAEQLHYTVPDKPMQAGDLTVPTVQGFSDVLYYFVGGNTPPETLYEQEFEPTGQPATDNGLSRIDHIGHTVHTDLYQSNTLFHRAMLGLDAEESLDLFDPYGIVYSRVLKNHDSQIRISLNARQRPAAPNNDPTSESAVASSRAGIGQLALATTDIFRTADAIQDKTLVLSIPANYYDDLRAKSVLPEATISRMQQANILFDQQGDAHFYHFYLNQWEGPSSPGLFVEVVQRAVGYDRYGEVNAQVRLTAQARRGDN